MKQTFTLNTPFSDFFRSAHFKAPLSRNDGAVLPSTWVLKNLLAYSAALFVLKTRSFGEHLMIMN